MAPLHFGTLAFGYQVTDVMGPFDLLSNADKNIMIYLKTFGTIDEEAIAHAPEFIFHHIGETLDPVAFGSGRLTMVPTDTVDDCPELDYLIIGGSYASYELSQKYADFIKRHVEAGKILFTTCTGAAHVAGTGVLDGKNATVNHAEYDWIQKRYPKVKWTRETNWVIDGNIWTGSGAVAGMDMISYWLAQNFGLDVLTHGASMMDYEPRDIHGLFNVLPQRFDSSGNQISTHDFSKTDLPHTETE